MTTRRRHNTRPALAATLAWAGLWMAHPANAAPDDQAPPSEPDAQAEPVEREGGGGALGGSLDELLGLEDDGAPDAPARAGDAADPSRAALERSLSGREAQDEMLEALQQMDETADRLAELGDTGAVTQRLQEEVLRKLEVLIRHAEQQEQQRSGSSSSSSSSSASQQQRSPTDQASAQQQSERPASRPGSENRGGDAAPPARQAERLNDMIESASAAWGSLPERVRQSLMQGLNDRFSALYERETEAYYRRLAEEAAANEEAR